MNTCNNQDRYFLFGQEEFLREKCYSEQLIGDLVRTMKLAIIYNTMMGTYGVE
jgi:hypothetical protein